jgi:hypothetical protein
MRYQSAWGEDEMKRYEMYTYTKITTSWGEKSTRAALSARERADGQWVKYEDAVKLMKDFTDELKQLCKDFSDLRDRPYMGDVHNMFDSLLERFMEIEDEQNER